MSFSIIIPSKTAENLIPCVEALRQHGQTERIIVIDDGLDLSAAHAKSLQHCWLCDMDPTLLVPGVKPFIFARNVNIGINVTREPLDVTRLQDAAPRYVPGAPTDVVLLNDDALLQTPGGFTMLAQFAAEHPEVGCVAPSTNITGQALQWPQHRTPEGWRYVDCVPYVCVYIPRRTLERVGLLDEQYCLDYGVEDRDHIEAMTRAGLKVAVLYDVFVDHGSLRSSFRGDPRMPKSFIQNQALFNRKWGRA